MNLDNAAIVGIAFLVLVLFLTSLLLLAKLREHFREEPPPAKTYATKGEVSEIKQDVHDLSNRMDRRFADFGVESKRDREQLHEKINGIGREVSSWAAITKEQGQTLASMDVKISKLLER